MSSILSRNSEVAEKGETGKSHADARLNREGEVIGALAPPYFSSMRVCARNRQLPSLEAPEDSCRCNL